MYGADVFWDKVFVFGMGGFVVGCVFGVLLRLIFALKSKGKRKETINEPPRN